MSERPDDFLDKINAHLQQLSERERVLLMVAAGVLTTMLIVLFAGISIRSIQRLERAIDEEHASLTRLLAVRSDYVEAAARDAAMELRLTQDPVQLASFIEARAEDAGVSRPRNFRDHQQPLPSGDIVADECTATFSNMTLGDLDNLMNEILMSGELVYVQHVNAEPGRGRGAEGLQVELTLATYRRGGEE